MFWGANRLTLNKEKSSVHMFSTLQKIYLNQFSNKHLNQQLRKRKKWIASQFFHLLVLSYIFCLKTSSIKSSSLIFVFYTLQSLPQVFNSLFDLLCRLWCYFKFLLQFKVIIIANISSDMHKRRYRND